MKNTLFILFTILLSSCAVDDSEKEVKTDGSSSKIDQILGDKVVDFKKEIIRENNFDDFLKLSVDDLGKKSELYKVKEIGNGFFHLTPKKRYLEARNFEIIIKICKDSIVNYYTINDEQIIGSQISNDTLFILTQNDESHPYWKKVNGVNIYSMNQDLNVLWKYQPNNAIIGLNAVPPIDLTSNQIIFNVQVLEASTEVYAVYQVQLSKSGKFKGYEYISSMNTRNSPSDEFLNKLFAD